MAEAQLSVPWPCSRDSATILKSTGPGGRVTIGATPRDGEVVLFVGDTGRGTSAEETSHLFDRFWQAQKADRRGAGLGMSIVKRLVADQSV